MAFLTALDVVEFGSEKHRASNVEFAPVANVYDNNAQVPLANRDRPRVGALYSQCSFTTDINGSGSAGTEPFDKRLWEACAMEETVVGETSVTYAPHALLTVSPANIDCYKGNQYLTSCDNAAGTFTIELVPNEAAHVNWEFFGTYVAPTSASSTASLDGDYSLPPVCKGLTATVGGFTSVLKSLTITLGNNIPIDEDIAGTNGIQTPIPVDRITTAEATMHLPAPSSKNIWSTFTSETKFAISAVIGSDAGNICTITMDMFLNAPPTYGEENGIHTVTIAGNESKESGDNQLSIAYT